MQLNFFPIAFDFDKYHVFNEPYSHERLIELRKLYNVTHSFFRFGDFIYISNKDGNDSQVLGKLTERRVYEDKEVPLL